MPIPENPLELPEEEQIKYLDGLKGEGNKVIDFGFILRLKKPWEFAGFVECIEYVTLKTDYSGLHVNDPNWFEFGRYQIGILEPELLQNLDEFLRIGRKRKLQDDQILTTVCCYTQHPTGDGRFRDGWGGVDRDRRADLVIPVEGGLFDHWGQFMWIFLVTGSEPFELNTDSRLIEQIKNKAKEVGKKEMTEEEAKQDWNKRFSELDAKDEAVDRYFAEQQASELEEL